MKKINRVSNSRFIKISNNKKYKGTYSRIKDTDSVGPVASSSPANNEGSNNKFINLDMYYEKMKSHNKEYKKFYKTEQELEYEAKNLHNEDDDLLKKIIKYVNSYNNVLVSLKEFDKSFDTNHSENIISAVKDYSPSLEDIGLKLLSDGQILIYKATLKKTIIESPSSLLFITGENYGLFYKIYKMFQNVKISSSEKSKYENSNIHGNIIDAKC